MKKKPDIQIIQKRKNGKWAVRKRGGGYIHGVAKVKILVEAGKIKTAIPTKDAEPVEAPAAEAAPAE